MGGKRYKVGYNAPIHGIWGLQYVLVTETNDLQKAHDAARELRALGQTKVIIFDTQEKIVCESN